MALPAYVILVSRPNPDGTQEVTYSFGYDDRVTVIIERTDNLAAVIYATGQQLAKQRE